MAWLPPRSDSQIGLDPTKQSVCSSATQPGPERGADIVVKPVSIEIGRGVFAGRHFKHGDLVFQERPALIATHDTFNKECTQDAPTAYASLPERERLLMQAAFTALASAAAESAPSDALQSPALSDISSKLCQPATAQVVCGPDQRLVHQSSKTMGWRCPSESRAVLEWFRAYAFRLPESQGRHQGVVYLVGSLINHACGNPNANFSFAGDHLRVIARRDIEEGEEILINYGRQRKEFHCLCEQCLRGGQGHHGRSWRGACSPT